MEDLSKLQVSVGKLETSMMFALEQNKKLGEEVESLDEKLDLILVKLTVLGAEREADLHSLRFSLKKKIGDSIHELKTYHDKDLETMNGQLEKMKWTQWPSTYPKVTAFIIVAVTLTIFETAWGSRELIKEIVEFFT